MTAGRGVMRRAAWLGATVLLVGGLVGCTPSDPLQIAKLQEENARLRQENNDLRTRIQNLINENNRNMQRIAQLQGELDAARGQLAAVPKSSLPPDWKQEGGVAWKDLSVDILFAPGKIELSSAGRDAIRQAASQIKNSPELSGRGIWVVGHTDSDPIQATKDRWIDNLDLSVNRGATVVREFYALGLDPRTVVAAGQGQYNPVQPNNSRANKAKNRRVQIIAIQKPPSTESSTPSAPSSESGVIEG